MTDLAPEIAHARTAGLTYVSDINPGYRRRRAGKGFAYLDGHGRVVTDKAVLARVCKLAIPPAWSEVWICEDANGHIQATGRDAKGRKQYLYHADWRQVRDEHKFDRMIEFALALPQIRARVLRDMARRGADRQRVLATVVNLLDRTLIRVGNDEYARQNGSFGLTTLRNRHVQIAGDALRFHFKGKSGKVWKLQVKDRRIARIVRALQDLPGQQLFQYSDDDGQIRTVSSSEVNDYLREISSPDVTAKDFRTWAGTVLAAMALTATGPFETKTQAKMKVKQAIEAVAQKLGNTPTICRKCYVHPLIIESYLAGALPPVVGGAAQSSGLPPEERAVLRMLKRVKAGKKPGPGRRTGGAKLTAQPSGAPAADP